MNREQIIGILRAKAGCGYGTDRAGEYESWLYPYDTQGNSEDMASHQETCGLNGLAFLRLLYLDHPYLRCSYASRMGLAISDLLTIARQMGLMKAPEAPRIGDVAHVIGPDHIIVVAGYDPATGIYTTSEGGAIVGTGIGIVEREEMVILDKQNGIHMVPASKPYNDAGLPNGRLMKELMGFSKFLPTELPSPPGTDARP